jgi:enterochelin esterase family protein
MRTTWLITLAVGFQVTSATFTQRAAGQEASKPLSPGIATLQKELDAGNPTALAKFWEDLKRAPFVESIPDDARHCHVTFVWRAKEPLENVVVVSALNFNRFEQGRMERLADSDLWYKTYRLRDDTRLLYMFVTNDPLTDWSKLKPKEAHQRSAAMRPDPLNPIQHGPKNDGGYRHSVLELPKAPPQRWVERRPKVPAGTLTETKFKSQILDNERAVTVYTPPGYTREGPAYGLLVVFDRGRYMSDELVPAPVILDNLLDAEKIRPLVAVFVGNVNRNKELPCYAPFAEFLARELVPWVRREYRVTDEPSQTIVAGSSYGGLAAAFAALKHPEVFGNVLSQSGSFYWWAPGEDEHEWLIRQFVASRKLPVRFYLDVGLLELGIPRRHAPTAVAANRHLRDVLQAKGYEVHYEEFNGGHDHFNWRGTFADGLLALVGQARKPVEPRPGK